MTYIRETFAIANKSELIQLGFEKKVASVYMVRNLTLGGGKNGSTIMTKNQTIRLEKNVPSKFPAAVFVGAFYLPNRLGIIRGLF